MKTMVLQTVVYKEGRFFVAQCLNVDISSFGSSTQKALDNLKEALELYFEDAPKQEIAVVESPAIIPLNFQHA